LFSIRKYHEYHVNIISYAAFPLPLTPLPHPNTITIVRFSTFNKKTFDEKKWQSKAFQSILRFSVCFSFPRITTRKCIEKEKGICITKTCFFFCFFGAGYQYNHLKIYFPFDFYSLLSFVFSILTKYLSHSLSHSLSLSRYLFLTFIL